jgi:hypothetical protein
MTAPLDVDAQLLTLEHRDWRSPSEALAAIAEVTASVNAQLASASQTYGVTGGDVVPDRLEHWIERLSAVAADVARVFGALSYSVGVSIPGGVSVSISWQANDYPNRMRKSP